MKKGNYTVYKHTSPSNKVYIGITSKEPEMRWRRGNGYYNNKHFYRTIQKYGWDNIKHEILFSNLTKEKAEQKEIELIKEHNSTNPKYGYNHDYGGNCSESMTEETRMKISIGNKGKVISKETRDKIGKFHKGRKHNKPFPQESRDKLREINTGKTLSESVKYKIKQKSKRYAVRQYSMDGELIAEYSGIRVAARALGLHSESITKCCKGKVKTCGGYIWRYADEELLEGHLQWCKTDYRGGKQTVYQYSKDEVFVAKYDSITSASIVTNISISNIRSCLIGKTKSAGGFIWKHERNNNND